MSSKKLHYEAISARIIVSGCSNEVETSFFSVCLFFFKFARKYLGNTRAATTAFQEKKIPPVRWYSSVCATQHAREQQQQKREGTTNAKHLKTVPGTAGETECNS